MRRGMVVSMELLKLLLNRVICGLALCMLLWLMSGSVLALVNQNSISAAGTSSQSESTVNVVVSSTGCSPPSATQAAGQITLRVTNNTGQSELSVQLYGSKGELIREVNIAQGMTEWSETFDLTIGKYTLIAGHKTEWVCHITVQ